MSHVDREDAIQGKIVHEYDGIEEADNDLPKWWLYIFYTSIVFAGCYWYVYHELGAQPLPNQAYTEAVMARAGTEVTEELLVAMAADSSAVAMGADIFAANCVVCHN
ncbi:MAG: cbb3-type cytochrome c oxidase N-terminal domain-containing protein, partial [Myxococcota bacterium]